MTRPDGGPEEGNPFDLGLPMVNTPVGKKGRKRRPARRNPRRPQPPAQRPAAPPRAEPGSPIYPGGDWERWLEPGQQQIPEPTPEPEPARRIPIGGPLEDPDLVDRSTIVPQLVDRSGGNPGSAFRRPRSRSASPRGDHRRSEKLLAALTLIGVGIVVISVVLTVIHTGNKRSDAKVHTTPAPLVPAVSTATATGAAPQSSIAADGCQQKRTGQVISGTDAGGTASGSDAILAFERAYYVQRSGYAARAVVADGSSVPSADQIQRGINQIPVGTRYCVQITGTGNQSQWEVRLTQQKPGEQPREFTQIIGTRTDSGRNLITSIASG